MPLPSAFKVATEFKFEIGQALLGTKTLTNNVNALSNAADNVLVSFERLGLGIALQFGTGGAGVLGVIRQAIDSSETFFKSQIDFANIIAANRKNLVGPVEDFNQQMQIGGELLTKISRQARQFSLPERQFVQMAKLLTAQLAPKGLLGEGFGNPIELARNFLKAAPTLGIDPGQAAGQFQRALEGGATMGDTFFRRITLETESMAEFAGSAKKFNQLKPHVRLQKLLEGLRQFTRSTDVLEARTQTITQSIVNLRNVLAGLDGIVKPLGDSLRPALVGMIHGATDVLNKQGRVIFLELARAIAPATRDIKGSIASLMQIRDLRGDVKRTETVFGVGAVFLGLGWILSKLVKVAWLAHPAIGAVAAAMALVWIAFKRMEIPLASIGGIITSLLATGGLIGVLAIFGKLGVVVRFLGFALTRLFFPMTIVLAIFQLISRAVAIAKIKDALALPELIARIVPLLNRLRAAFGKLIRPFALVFNFLAEMLAPLFQRTLILQTVLPAFAAFVGYIEAIAQVMEDAAAATSGYIEVVKELLQASFLRPGGPDFNEAMATAWRRGLDKVFKGGDEGVFGKTPAVNQVTNIHGGVHINNSFKEQMQPDRIAFSLKEQLLKAAQNPTQSRKRTFARPALGTATGGQ